MSVRLIKISALVLISHVILFSVVLIGFPIPAPKLGAEFIYAGQLVADEAADAEALDGSAPALQWIEFDHFDAPTFKPWVKLRGLNKPK